MSTPIFELEARRDRVREELGAVGNLRPGTLVERFRKIPAVFGNGLPWRPRRRPDYTKCSLSHLRRHPSADRGHPLRLMGIRHRSRCVALAAFFRGKRQHGDRICNSTVASTAPSSDRLYMSPVNRWVPSAVTYTGTLSSSISNRSIPSAGVDSARTTVSSGAMRANFETISFAPKAVDAASADVMTALATRLCRLVAMGLPVRIQLRYSVIESRRLVSTGWRRQ